MPCNGYFNRGCSDNCCESTVALSGMVVGASGPASGITVQYTVHCRTLTTTTDATGRYTIMAPMGACVTITVGPLVGVTVTPPSYSLMACASRTDLNFTLTAVTPTTFTVSGMVTGLPSVSGIVVNYTVNGSAASTVTDASGNFSITAPSGASVVLTPSAQAGFTVSPANYSIASLSGNVTGRIFSYTQTATNFTVSGAVTGLPSVSGIGIGYVLNGSTGLTTTTDANGNYSITAPAGSSIVITPSVQAGFDVTPPNYAIATLNGDVSGQNFTYNQITATRTISGKLSNVQGALANQAFTYLINGQSFNAMTDANGNYSINVPSGSNVVIQPPQIANYSVLPLNLVFNNISSNQSGQNFFFNLLPNLALISGVVVGLANNANVPVIFTINGQGFSTTTNSLGIYNIIAPFGSNVVVSPVGQTGYTVQPFNHVLNNVLGNAFNQNFVYSAI